MQQNSKHLKQIKLVVHPRKKVNSEKTEIISTPTETTTKTEVTHEDVIPEKINQPIIDNEEFSNVFSERAKSSQANFHNRETSDISNRGQDLFYTIHVHSKIHSIHCPESEFTNFLREGSDREVALIQEIRDLCGQLRSSLDIPIVEEGKPINHDDHDENIRFSDIHDANMRVGVEYPFYMCEKFYHSYDKAFRVVGKRNRILRTLSIYFFDPYHLYATKYRNSYPEVASNCKNIKDIWYETDL